MTSLVNTQQSEMWNGYEGTRWAEQEDRWDAINGVFNADLFDAADIATHHRVLDVGCGNGQTTRLAARAAREGEAVGIDLSVPMLDRARAAANREGLANVRFVEGDAQAYPFSDAEFDVNISRFGLTFFADAVAALGNIHRALRPGGRLAAICVGDYSRGDWASVIGAMATSLPLSFLAQPNPRDALADPDNIDAVLSAAGFTEVSTTEVIRPNIWGSSAEDAAEFLLNFGPVHSVYEQVDADTAAGARNAVAGVFKTHLTDNGVLLHTPAWLISAIRP